MNAPSPWERTWLLQPPEAAAAAVRLFCLPYAGGGTWIFRDWQRHLGPEIAVCPIKLPGRGDRLRDTPTTDLVTLARTLASGLRAATARPYALFGHSMGALVAYECVLALKALGCPAPRHLFISGATAPSRLHVAHPLHGLSDDAFLEGLFAKYAHPSLRLVDPEVLALMLPTLRADMMMFETYRHRPVAPLEGPLTVLVGTDDPIPREHLQAWRDLVHTPPHFEAFPGGHFYLHGSEALLLRALHRQLQADSDGHPA